MKLRSTLAARPSLMLVDDESRILAAMVDYFGLLGYEVDGAADGESAQALFAERRHQVVITDLRLSRRGGLDGLDLVERVRRLAPQTACIVVTAHGGAEPERQARQLGAAAFLQKPVPLADLAAAVDAALAHEID